ncbi:Ubiquinone biosynthesis O-methyltransferase [uncultured archaeon]|nr:Ubiquinone biosynthesis O-methyltransferase [uncultured archaeon]
MAEEGLLTGFLIRQRNTEVARRVSGKSVLDIGCERGSLKRFLPKGISYTGMDLLPREKFRPDFGYFTADIQKGIPEELLSKFDCVAMAAVVEHLTKPEKAMENCFKALMPGGMLIITTPTKRGDWLHKLLSRIGLVSSDAAEDHQKIFEMQELKGLIEKKGFNVLETSEFQLGMNQLVVAEKPGKSSK